MYKNMNKNVTQQQTTTTLKYRLLTWDRHKDTECGEVKHVSGIPTLPLNWERGVTIQHKNEL